MQEEVKGLIVLMGVSGCGKSTIGAAVGKRLNVAFVDGDDLHPESNKQKMAAGVPLDDSDREPWLQAICDAAELALEKQTVFVVACSALKKIYREQLRTISHPVTFVHLYAPQSTIAARQASRPGHFMPPTLLASQYQTLESPTGEPNVIELSVEQSLEDSLEQLLTALKS